MLRRASQVVVVGFLLVLFVPNAGIAGGCHASSQMTTGRTGGNATIDIANCGYSPAILYVEPGSEVTWVNQDPLPHTVTGAGLSLGGDKYIESGERTESFRFDDTGVYPYYCMLHPGMTGAVVVGDVSADQAAAGEVQSMPVAVPAANEQPPTGPAEEGSSVVVLMLIAIAAAIAAAGFLIGRWRKERDEPQPA